MDSNSEAFMVFVGNFIDSFIDLLSNHFILGYSWWSVITGCLIITWLLSKLGLHSGKQPKQSKGKTKFHNFKESGDPLPSDDELLFRQNS